MLHTRNLEASAMGKLALAATPEDESKFGENFEGFPLMRQGDTASANGVRVLGELADATARKEIEALLSKSST